MSNTPTPPVSKGRLWLNAFVLAFCGSLGYLVVGLINQTPPLFIAISMVAIIAIVAPFAYWMSARRAKLGTPPRRP
ncbi:MAG: hypothetical protein K0S37_1029 [Microbacterium sp.]|jgi:hypothetical protein|nr:hypothetical protein [Microbacterium sp.]